MKIKFEQHDMISKMMKRLYSTYDNVKELCIDLSSIRQKVDSYAVFIRQIEQQLSELPLSVNPRQQGTLPSNMIQNIVNDDQFIVVTTQGRKKIVDPSVPTVMKDAKELNDAEMEEAEKPKYQVGKEDEATKKILLLFPKRLKQLLIIVPLIDRIC